MGGSYSKVDLSPLQDEVVVIHPVYCKDEQIQLTVQYDWTMDCYKIFDKHRIYFYTDYRVSFSRKLVLLDAYWHAVGNIKKKSNWFIYKGGSSEDLVGDIISMSRLNSKLKAKVKLSNGDILEMIIEGKGMVGQVWIGDPKLDGIPVAWFDFYDDNDCKVEISKGMDISIIILLFLVYRKTQRR